MVSTKIWKRLDFRFGVTLRFDNAPAPLPPFKNIPFAMGFHPLAEKTDVTAEAALIVNFL